MTPGDEEEEKDWQPMSKAMSDALEMRWVEGWEGDNGTDDFFINLNGSMYGQDVYCMWQWKERNKTAGRAREIRRVENDQTERKLLLEKLDRLEKERSNSHERLCKVEFLGDR